MPSSIGRTIGGNHQNPNKYKLEQIIGQGSFGKVYKSGGVAVKEILLQNMQPYLRTALSNEIKILKSFKHPNIVSLYDIIYEEQYVYLVMEYCEMDLAKYMKKYKLDEARARVILRQIVGGFSQLVEKGIIHRDLKPANILVNSKGEFKLADFGFAKVVEHFDTKLLHSIVGTPLYMAPQILKKSKYTTKCDIWSIGFIYFELLTSTMPWNGTSESNLYSNITKNKLQIPSYVSDWSRNLLTKMLVVSENDRISWDELITEVLKNSSSDSHGTTKRDEKFIDTKDRKRSSEKALIFKNDNRHCPSPQVSEKQIGAAENYLKFNDKRQTDEKQKRNANSEKDRCDIGAGGNSGPNKISVKLRDLQQIFELELLEYFSIERSKEMSKNVDYRFTVDEMIKVNKVIEVFNDDIKRYIKETYIGMK